MNKDIHMATAAKYDTENCVDMSVKAQEIKNKLEDLKGVKRELDIIGYRRKVLKKELKGIEELVDVGSQNLVKCLMMFSKEGCIENVDKFDKAIRHKIKNLQDKLVEIERESKKNSEREMLYKQVKELNELIEQQEEMNKFACNGFGRRGYKMIKCFTCNRFGHKADRCQSRKAEKMKENMCFKQIDNKRRWYVDELTIEGLKMEYKNLTANQEEEIKFCEIGKCAIETVENKMVVQKGSTVPQALERKAQEYIDGLLRRKIIRESQSNWRNPVRFLEKSNGEVRIVVNLIKLNNLVVKEIIQSVI
ncbi:hypothetical protein BDAP_000046 [Binucleata daphniae]